MMFALPVIDACPDENDIVAFAEGLVPEARREAIARHLDRCAACRALTVEAIEPEADSQPATPAAPRRGQALGRYLVLEPLGAGGLGEVFLAYDPELDRRVAVKRLRRELGGSGSSGERERLIREARMLAKLAHPNVVVVYDVGVQDGHVFIAMEYVAGETLQTWIAAAPRGWAEVLEVFVQAAHGLIAAHELGMVHRDFKPANVLLGRDGRTRVADFGLANAWGAPPSMAGLAGPVDRGRTEITESGMILGTPAYMAPEQHAGARVDARADQFAFCVALYEATHGARPFVGDGIDALASAKQHGRIAGGTAPALPPWLRRAILRGLAARPEDRFASMAELVAELTSDQRRRRGRARAWRLTAAGAVLAAAVSATLWWRTPSAELLAQVEQLHARALTHAGEGAYVFPPIEQPRAETAYTVVRAIERLDDRTGTAQRAADELRRRLADELVARADVAFDDADRRLLALELYTSALVFDPRQPRALERARLPAWLVADLGHRAETGALTDDELVIAAFSRSLFDADAAPSPEQLTELRGRAERLPPSVRSQLAPLLGGDPPATGTTLALAPVDTTTPRPEPAVAADEPTEPSEPDPTHRAVVRAPTRPKPAAPEPDAPRDPDEAARRALEGTALLRRGDIDAAEASFHRALEADASNFAARSGLAELLFEAGRYPEAERYAKQCMLARPNSATHRIHLGDIQFKLHKYKDARAQYEKAAVLGDARAARRIEQLDQRLGHE